MKRALLPLLLLALCGLSLLIGAKQMAGDSLLTLTGVGLAVCGVILQQIARNRFVEPATTGGLGAPRALLLSGSVAF